MAFFVTGDPPVTSTQTTASDPSTAALIAHLNSTETLSVNRGGIYNLNLWLGASTAALWWFERALSSGLGSTAIRERHVFRTASGQMAQFVRKIVLEKDDLLRVRVGSTFTGDADAILQVERLE